MTTLELLVIFLVTLVVFGPSKLPMIATHLAKLVKVLNQFKNEASSFLQKQLDQQQLLENQKKAEKADTEYLEQNTDQLESTESKSEP